MSARHVELTTTLREGVERKLRRLDRVAHPESEAVVELIGRASHATDSAHVAEVTLVSNGTVLRSTSPGATPLAAVDAVVDKLERQIVRSKQRPRSLRERSASEAPGSPIADAAWMDEDETGGEIGDAESRIVKTKRFDLQPMFEEDAIAQMDDLGHAFFVFLNAETDRVAIVYRRRDGRYGLIDPIVERRRPSR